MKMWLRCKPILGIGLLVVFTAGFVAGRVTQRSPAGPRASKTVQPVSVSGHTQMDARPSRVWTLRHEMGTDLLIMAEPAACPGGEMAVQGTFVGATPAGRVFEGCVPE